MRRAEKGASQFCWSDSCMTRPLIGEAGPTIVFDKTFDGEQRGGAQFQPAAPRPSQSKENGMYLWVRHFWVRHFRSLLERHQQPAMQGVEDGVPRVALTPLGLLAGVVSRRPAALRRLRRLGVGRRRGLGRGASGQFAPEGAKPVHHPGEDPVATPEIEILLDRRRGRKTMRKCPPLASGVAHSLDRVGHLPEVGLAGACSLGRSGRHGSTRAHSSSVKSLSNRARGRAI